MASWLTRISSSSGNSSRSLIDICLGDHRSASFEATWPRSRPSSSLRTFGLRARLLGS